METTSRQRHWFWATLILSSISIVALVFAFWELVENRFFQDADYVSLHYLYISRGIASSLLLATWAAWFVFRERRRAESELRRSQERYLGILEASPSAVTLYDGSLVVLEWNASAERLYGFSKADVLGQPLPIVPRDKEEELRDAVQRIDAGEPVIDVETCRRHRNGSSIDVQLSLLPFSEIGHTYYLEVTSDIRERVRLRERLIEFEKLTTMGTMAAGTAHHLNTPLASMLLRVQMMRSGNSDGSHHLDRLEETLGFCQQFVRRLLDFSRRPTAQKQPEEITGMFEAVLGFLSPSLQAKGAHITFDVKNAAGMNVLADRNQIETLLLILLSNSLDAIQAGGHIAVECQPIGEALEFAISDDGIGISEADAQRIFEPFFTTKPPGKGTGLGLAIAKSIVAEHGGTLSLEGRSEGGARALVRLPLPRVASEVVPAR